MQLAELDYTSIIAFVFILRSSEYESKGKLSTAPKTFCLHRRKSLERRHFWHEPSVLVLVLAPVLSLQLLMINAAISEYIQGKYLARKAFYLCRKREKPSFSGLIHFPIHLRTYVRLAMHGYT